MNQKVVTSNKIASLKKNLRGKAEIEYQDAYKLMKSWEETLLRKQGELVEAENKLVQLIETQSSIYEVRSWQQFIDVCKSEIVELKIRVHDCSKVCQTKHEVLVETYIDEQKWSEYRDHLVLLQKKSFEYAEQKFLDELAVQRNSRFD